VRLSVRVAALLCGPVLLLAGCGRPAELAEPPGPTLTGPTSPGISAPAFPTLPPGQPGAPTSGFQEGVAISCGGQPDPDELLDLLRAEGILAAGAEAQVVTGPLCAGGWQYAVVSVPDLDPLQVVTRGEPGALELVTAGTDVCTVEIRIEAPPGIRDVAACVT
jgi:hypothetical protein